MKWMGWSRSDYDAASDEDINTIHELMEEEAEHLRSLSNK